MNIQDAAHKTVKEYPGGSESLAPRLGMSAAVLRNKVNPNTATHHLTLAEADELMSVTDDFRILHALAATHGFVLQRADAPESGSLIQGMLAAAAGQGDLAHIVAQAMEDGRITPNEVAQIEKACTGLQHVLAHVASHAAAASRQGAPDGR